MTFKEDHSCTHSHEKHHWDAKGQDAYAKTDANRLLAVLSFETNNGVKTAIEIKEGEDGKPQVSVETGEKAEQSENAAVKILKEAAHDLDSQSDDKDGENDEEEPDFAPKHPKQHPRAKGGRTH